MKTITEQVYEVGEVIGTVEQVLALRTITAEHNLFGSVRVNTPMALCHALGRIYDSDTDKRVQVGRDGLLRVESDQQRDARIRIKTNI